MQNGVLFQAFEWYCPDDGSFYRSLMERVPDLASNGITAVWLPPVTKGTGVSDVGYGVYDLYDLGEFDQKGTVRTKYGTKDELRTLIARLHEARIQVYLDVVLNHMGGADETERFLAVKVDSSDRNREIEPPREIEGWTCFKFPGRTKAYSPFEWHHHHFSGVDFDNLTGEKAIFRIIGENKGWNWGVSSEHGNFDYLMYADIDHAHPEVKGELFRWADWFIHETGADGFRLDAVKHIDQAFMKEFQANVRESHGEPFYLFGEYWQPDIESKKDYLHGTDCGIDLFDVSLHYHLHAASIDAAGYDLRKLFDRTLVRDYPQLAVTFVDNHDTQPGQSLQSWVEPWFKEIAYALILLRRDGYPCVFAGDYFGSRGEHPYDGLKPEIDRLLEIRRQFAFGDQTDFFADARRIGWVRHGDEAHPQKIAVIVSSGDAGVITMSIGESEAGRRYMDCLRHHPDTIVIREDGSADFPVAGGRVSVWIAAD